MIQSLVEPQLVPSDHIYVVVQDHGPNNGGWGPSVMYSETFKATGPAIYTGNSDMAISYLKDVAEKIATQTGKKTKLLKYTAPVEIASF